MFCDKPIIASRIPSSVELAPKASFFSIDDADEFYQAIHDAIADKHHDARRSMAKDKLAQYSWENLAKTYVGNYRRALALSKAEKSLHEA
jgi:glycosyltransferase involved in cell wall biosynthesis